MTLAAVIVIAALQYCKTLPWAIYFGSGSGNLAWPAFLPFPFPSILFQFYFQVHIPHPGSLLCASISRTHRRASVRSLTMLLSHLRPPVPLSGCTAPPRFLPVPAPRPFPYQHSVDKHLSSFLFHLSASIRLYKFRCEKSLSTHPQIFFFPLHFSQQY